MRSANRVLDGSLFVDITVVGDAVALEQAMAIGDTLATVDTIELVIDLNDPDSVQQDSVLKYRLQH